MTYMLLLNCALKLVEEIIIIHNKNDVFSLLGSGFKSNSGQYTLYG